ncbi:MAG: hypothetical protein RIF32_00610 [Leptospirales bacterium]|jgi:hypothetical protein
MWVERIQTAILIILVLISAGALPFSEARAESLDHVNMGVLIDRNQSDLRYLDTCISNLSLNDTEGDPDALRAGVIGLFREALQHDYHANLWYMQGKYSAAHKEMQKSQNFLQQAYEKVLRRYNDTTMALLDAAAPIALRTRDQSAGHLLRTAFRDLTHARNFHTRGSNINPRYHTNQLHYYRSGIERARRARRYGLLAMIEARLPLEERDRYQLVTYDDVRTGARENDPKMNDYTRVEAALRNMISRKLIPAEVGTRNLPVPVKLLLLEIHQDSHGRLIEDRASVWLTESDQLDLSRFYADYSLPKRNLENRNDVPAADSDPVELEDASVPEAAPATEDRPNANADPIRAEASFEFAVEGQVENADSEDDSYF